MGPTPSRCSGRAPSRAVLLRRAPSWAPGRGWGAGAGVDPGAGVDSGAEVRWPASGGFGELPPDHAPGDSYAAPGGESRGTRAGRTATGASFGGHRSVEATHTRPPAVLQRARGAVTSGSPPRRSPGAHTQEEVAPKRRPAGGAVGTGGAAVGAGWGQTVGTGGSDTKAGPCRSRGRGPDRSDGARATALLRQRSSDTCSCDTRQISCDTRQVRRAGHAPPDGRPAGRPGTSGDSAPSAAAPGGHRSRGRRFAIERLPNGTGPPRAVFARHVAGRGRGARRDPRRGHSLARGARSTGSSAHDTRQ